MPHTIYDPDDNAIAEMQKVMDEANPDDMEVLQRANVPARHLEVMAAAIYRTGVPAHAWEQAGSGTRTLFRKRAIWITRDLLSWQSFHNTRTVLGG